MKTRVLSNVFKINVSYLLQIYNFIGKKSYAFLSAVELIFVIAKRTF